MKLYLILQCNLKLNIMTAKEELFKVMDRIDVLKNTPFGLNAQEELELRNLEVKKMCLYSKWKD